ncbi:prenyltransferase/squalene oxidase repeat-containing protein [Poriferisphaera sp. WC338]|uniref:prenyltransferase/squalene oxidase repeat-containing protein n=1 Tax=Poriferisphaera sp. WC338 TaxID=3425129 RepID=UPI003D815DAE
MNDMKHDRIGVMLVLVCMLSLLGGFQLYAVDAAHQKKADDAIAKAIKFLEASQQDDGAWTPQPGPAITAMIMGSLLETEDVSLETPIVARALEYVMSKVRSDGSISEGFLENYNTAICLSALSKIKGRTDVTQAITKGQQYLTGLQWVGQKDPNGNVIDSKHAYYGGAGYGKHGRPDLSNTQFMIQALHDTGLSVDDPAYERALVFISRCQGVEQNDLFSKGEITQDGGFIYATSINKDHIGVAQSQASPEGKDEALAGKPVSGLRTYGSMTYAGFKSMLYAGLKKNDPRVQAAYGWICGNYGFDVNPGMPKGAEKQGLYYYLMTAGRALSAWGESMLPTQRGNAVVMRDWQNDLIDAIVAKQAADGSWSNDADRWMEGDQNLVTAYCLIALIEAKQ